MCKLRMKFSVNSLFYLVLLLYCRRIAWLDHVMRMDDKRTPKRILEWKPVGTRIRGRPRKRWIVDIEEDMHNGNKTVEKAM